MIHVSRKGCIRTALEYSKLVYALDLTDPLGVSLYVQYLALRCHEVTRMGLSWELINLVRLADRDWPSRDRSHIEEADVFGEREPQGSPSALRVTLVGLHGGFSPLSEGAK